MDYLPFFTSQTWILLAMFFCLFVVYGKWTFGIFEKLGIPGPKPVMYFGTITKHNKVYYLGDLECAQKYGRVWGMFECRKPVLTVMEPDMLRTILVKECFSHFINRRNLRLNGELYDALGIAEDDHWRHLRHTLSPSFTSGRIKEMFTIMKHQSCKLTTFLQSKARNEEVIKMKEIFGPYVVAVMAGCVLGVDMDLLSDPSDPFATLGTSLFDISVPLFLFQGFFPVFLPVLELLGASLFPKAPLRIFKQVVEKIRAERSESSHQNFRDMLQFMINTQTSNEHKSEEKSKGLSDHEIFTQCAMFVTAGSETSATTLGFLAYSLARNPEVMKRLQEEIDSTFPDKGPVDYEALQQMEYLDSVISETLRLYPPAARLERIAKERVKISGVTIPKGMFVMIPVYALHHDPELWPEPEEFRPDRFSKQNKQRINPYTYLPFGMGPRNCVGMRVALVMVKLAVVEILQNYSFSVCEETEIPLEMSPKGLLGPLNPIQLKLVMR